MKRDHRAYCFEFNPQGLCVTCGKPRLQFNATEWPKDTWHQQRLAKVLQERAKELRNELPEVQS